MRVKGLLLVSAFLIVTLALVAIIAGRSLPSDLTLPMHWNSHGVADRYAGKWAALLVLPVTVAVAGTLFGLMVTRIEPNRDALARSAGLVAVAWIGLLGLAWVIELMELAVAFRWPFQPVRLLIGFLGLFFVMLGNQFGKSRPMHMVGIRTPWTLADPDVWIATHRLGGKLLVAAGALWFAVATIGMSVPGLPIVLIVTMLAAAFIPVGWSYVLWRRHHPNT